MARTRVHGTDKVIGNLNAKIREIEGATMKGLLRAAILIRRDMDQTPPLIPVDWGNLRGSWFIDSYYMGRQAIVKMGFTANYAWYVHEMVGDVSWSRPGSGPKFFEASIKRNTRKALNIIAKEVSI